MNEKKQILFLYVNKVNVSFINNEIEQLRRYYIVKIISDKKLSVPKGQSNQIEYILLKSNINELNFFQRISVFYRNPFLIKLLLQDTFSKGTNLWYIKEIKNRIIILLESFLRYESLKSYLFEQRELQSANFLSFFFNNNALVLAIAVKKGVIMSFYSRCHGRDIFEYREPKTKKLAFRNFQLKYISKLFPASLAGETYLKEKYPTYSYKIKHQYLGTVDYGLGKIDFSEKFTIVSCGTVRNVKRFYLIPEILSFIDSFQIKWVHFGAIGKKDPTYKLFENNLNKLKKQHNVDIELRGKTDNAVIMDYYKNNMVHLFISVSETEGGCPVSIQEAISFGIPILATDAGGTREIVTNKNGILIPINFKTQDTAIQIINFKKSKLNSAQFRVNVRETWQNDFNAKKNYSEFVDALEL